MSGLALELYLTEPQERFVFSEARHPAMVAGFGAGKSEASVVRLLLKALQYPGMDFGFVEPTFDLVRLIAWPRFEQKLADFGIGYSLNKSESIIRIENGAKIIFRSAENPERLVGFEIADGVIDEADVLSTEKATDVWVKMLSRCRQKKPDGAPNTLAAVSTPEGYKWLYQTFQRDAKPGYELTRAPTYSNPYLPADYVDNLRKIYPAALIESYIEGHFTNLNSGSVYPDFDRRLNHTDAVMRPNDPLHVGADFNVTNCTLVLCVIRNGLPFVVDEVTGIRDTPAMASILKERYKGHAITVYPDATGRSRKTVDASESDLAILRQAGLMVRVDGSNPAVKDRINAVNGVILNAEGARRLMVNTDRCPRLTEALEQQAYDPRNGEPDKTSGHDHLNDALGYFVNQRYPIIKRGVGRAGVLGV